MPNGDQNTSRRADPRTDREKIADALIPRHCCFARGAYLLGNDAALLGFLAIPEYDESLPRYDEGAELAADLQLPEDERHSADLLQFHDLSLGNASLLRQCVQNSFYREEAILSCTKDSRCGIRGLLSVASADEIGHSALRIAKIRHKALAPQWGSRCPVEHARVGA